jgi:dihydropteroate synthase
LNREIPFGKKTLVMGIINVTPDSFYEGSRTSHSDRAIERALQMEELGADILDIGGESTRPGARSVATEEEVARVLPVVEGIRKRSDVILSVDTHKAVVAGAALERGADMVNDISGLGAALRFDQGGEHTNSAHGDQADRRERGEDTGLALAETVAENGAYIVLMHMRGVPLDMQTRTNYENVMIEVMNELDVAIERALKAGISRDRIIVDPGIGFAKTAEQNLQLIKNLPLLKEKGYPVLIGLSRKSFLGVYTGRETDERLAPTVAANAISISYGADIIRVHDVGEAVDTVHIVDAILKS